MMVEEVSFHYDPSRKGLGQILGDLEIEVMSVLWDSGRSSVREILEAIKRDVSYSSVITVANRLFKKGLLERDKEGKTFFYCPLLDRIELQELAAERILNRVSDLNAPTTVVHFIESIIGDDPEVLKALEVLIKKRKKGRKS